MNRMDDDTRSQRPLSELISRIATQGNDLRVCRALLLVMLPALMIFIDPVTRGPSRSQLLWSVGILFWIGTVSCLAFRTIRRVGLDRSGYVVPILAVMYFIFTMALAYKTFDLAGSATVVQ